MRFCIKLYLIYFCSKKGAVVPRLTVTISNDLYKKIKALSNENDESLSSVIAKMTETGLSHYQNNHDALSSNLSLAEEHCYKLIIQMNAIIKNLAAKQLDYTQSDFDKLRDASILKFNDLIGIKREEL